ncbi:MAG: hypothetical protein LIP23_10650 [Planctomycetes bacterium]|nr:hypothetical protein [Planctomycetota bacterium]
MDECAEFLLALVDNHPCDADLITYTAGLLGGMGDRQLSQALGRRAAAARPFFPSRVKNAKLRVLALQCIATPDYRYYPASGRFHLPGLTNLATLLDPDMAVHRLLVDDLPAALAAAKQLPRCDIVFNTISDPDYEQQLHNAAAVCGVLNLPVFNPPGMVRGLNRALLPALARGSGDKLMAAATFYLPPDTTSDHDIVSAMRANHIAFPIIIRAPGFQGGHQMKLLRRAGDELGEDLYRDNGLYGIEFIDVSFQDQRAAGCRFYPKYRAFFSHGQLFPIHLLVSDQYEVHKKTSSLVQSRHPWLHEMETDYIRAPERHLPAGLWHELHAAMSSFGLDYFGVDFAVSSRQDDCGKLVLFECNAAMANRIAVLPDGSEIQCLWRDVTLAAHYALCEKSGVPAWQFSLKKGLLLSK